MLVRRGPWEWPVTAHSRRCRASRRRSPNRTESGRSAGSAEQVFMPLSRRSRRLTTNRRLGEGTLSPCCHAPLPTRANVARSKARQHSLAHGHLGFAIIWTTRWLPLSADRSQPLLPPLSARRRQAVCPVVIADEGHHRSQQDHDGRSRRRASSPGSAAATLPSFRARPSPDENGGIPQRAKDSWIDLGPMKLNAPAPIITTPSAIGSQTAMSWPIGMEIRCSSC